MLFLLRSVMKLKIDFIDFCEDKVKADYRYKPAFKGNFENFNVN